MSGKVHQQYDHEVPSCWGPHFIDGMSELTSVGLRTWHFMAIDMLSSVFMSVANQQREVGKLYRNPRHNAMQWKWAVDQAQRESVNRLSKQLGMQTFFDSQVYPACLQNTPYANYAFPLQGQYYNQPVPYPPTQGSAKVCQSMAPGMYPSDSPTAAMATAQQGPVTEEGEPAPRRSPAAEMGFMARQAAVVEQSITTQHAEAAQRARAEEIELATRQAAAATTQQAVAAQASTSEMSAQPSIQVPPQLQRTFLTDEIIGHTQEEQEQYNYSETLSYNLDYSPDEDVSVIRSPGTDWDDPGTVTTDTEMTDAMTEFNLNSPADTREVLYSRTGMNLGLLSGVLPNLTNSNAAGPAEEARRSELAHILRHMVRCQSLLSPKGHHGEVSTTTPVPLCQHP